MPVAAFILSLVQPILARVLVSLGFSLVSFVGFDLALNQVIQAAEGAWGGLPSNLLARAGLSGIGQALGIIFGAILTKMMIWQLTKSTRMMMSNPG